MATEKQKKLAKAIVANSQNPQPLNKRELLVSAGYDETTAIATPQRVIQQKGVQDELKSLGFTNEEADNVVGQILRNEKSADKDRLKAAELVYKVTGRFGPSPDDKPQSVVNIFQNPNVLIATQMYEANLKQLIAHGTAKPVQETTQDTSPPQDAVYEGAG